MKESLRKILVNSEMLNKANDPTRSEFLKVSPSSGLYESISDGTPKQFYLNNCTLS